MIARLRGRRRFGYSGRHRPGASCCAGIGEGVDPWGTAPLFPAWYELRHVRGE